MSNQVISKIADYLGLAPEDIDKQIRLREDLDLSPIKLNDLLAHLSEEFKITFDPEDIENLESVDDLVVLIEDSLLDQQ